MSASSILYGFLSFNAQSNLYIQTILSPYSHLNDGYAALYALMYRTTTWLRTEHLGWANTPFNDDINPSQYATIIISSAQAALKTGEIEYDTTEQSKEILHQIMSGENILKLQ